MSTNLIRITIRIKSNFTKKTIEKYKRSKIQKEVLFQVPRKVGDKMAI